MSEPYENLSSLRRTAQETKDLVEELAGQRRSVLTAAVTWGDLLDLGLIKPDQIPPTLG